MFLDFLEKRSEEVDDTPRLTDEEKLFLKVFGIEEDQPAAAMKEATYFTCIKKLSEAVAKTPLYLTMHGTAYPGFRWYIFCPAVFIGRKNRRKKGKRTPVI